MISLPNILKNITIDFSDTKEVKFFKKINKEELYIIEKIKGLNCLKELLIDYKNKKGGQ